MAGSGIDFPELADDAGVSPAEREEIRAKIEMVVTENRIPVEATSFKPEGARRGILVPILVNAGIVIVAVAVILVLGLSSDRDDSRLRAQETQYSSVEGRLIRELRTEAQRQMSLKQREIQEVRDRLKELESRQAELKRDFDAKIKLKEAEFKALLEREIEAERARLATAGVGAAEIDARIKRFEADRRAYYEKELAKYRAQLEDERARMQADIDKLKTEYQTRLAALEREQRQIAVDYERRESELKTQLEQKTRIMERLSEARAGDLAAARAELASLVKAEASTTAIENQIDGLASRIRDELAAGDGEAALARVRELRAFLSRDEVRASSRLSGRIRSESILLAELEELLIGSLKPQETLASISPVQAAPVQAASVQAVPPSAADRAASDAADAARRAAEERISRLESQLEAEKRALADLASRAGAEAPALASRIDALKRSEAQLARAKAAYAAYVKSEAAARKANPADPNAVARLELSKFLRGADAASLFPDIATRVDSLYTATQSAGSSAALADAADIVKSASSQPNVKASRQYLAYEISSLKDGDPLKDILKAVDAAMAKAESGR